MSKSILQQNENVCFLCGCWLNVCGAEEHHIFGGYANRQLSEKYGLKVRLCHNCHNEPPQGVHHNKELMDRLRRLGQTVAMKQYGWSVDEFRSIFGKNYL